MHGYVRYDLVYVYCDILYATLFTVKMFYCIGSSWRTSTRSCPSTRSFKCWTFLPSANCRKKWQKIFTRSTCIILTNTCQIPSTCTHPTASSDLTQNTFLTVRWSIRGTRCFHRCRRRQNRFIFLPSSPTRTSCWPCSSRHQFLRTWTTVTIRQTCLRFFTAIFPNRLLLVFLYFLLVKCL